MNFFPGERHAEIYLQLSLNLRAIISQRLIPGVDGKRVAAMEILIDTPYVKDLIKKGEVDIIKEAMERSVQEGGQTFDQAIFQLFTEGRIDCRAGARQRRQRQQPAHPDQQLRDAAKVRRQARRRPRTPSRHRRAAHPGRGSPAPHDLKLRGALRRLADCGSDTDREPLKESLSMASRAARQEPRPPQTRPSSGEPLGGRGSCRAMSPLWLRDFFTGS